MKKIFLLASLALSANAVLAQDTYLNDRMTATDDVIGTARFVGMGGAMGALGADLSTISSNPAGLGLYRKSDVNLTAGAITPNGNGWDNTATGERKTHASFDQMGLVWSNRLGGKLKYINAAFNYQKKINYNQAFYADNQNLNHLSQMDQLAEMANEGYDTDYNLTGAAVDYGYLDKDEYGYYNRFSGEKSEYTRHSTGGVQSFDFNVSFNVNDRFYTGLTIGCDNLNYRGWSEYKEYSSTAQGELGDYKLANDRHVDGAGVNFKLGFIARPFEQNSFRVGLAIETPTWYHLKSSTLYALDDNKSDEAYLEYNITSPAKVRLSMGSTVDKYFAWGAEYEFANYGRTRMSYSDYTWYDYSYSFGSSSADKAMNQNTENTLRGQHTLRLGLEGKPCDAVALRLGYNYVTNRFKKGAHLDQFSIDSQSMDYATTTDFMNLSDVNILTAGIGFKYKFFYCDLAYKFRAQHGDFYPFDTSFTATGTDFAIDNPNLENAYIDPTKVNLNRHQVAMTIGFKF